MKKHQPKHVVTLTTEERKKLRDITKKGTQRARVIQRATLLLKSADGWKDKEIATDLETTTRTVENVRARFASGGLDRALYDAARSGQPRKLDDKAEAHLIALACTDPPEGADHWTLELLAEKMVTDKKVKTISSVAIMHYLHRNDLKPWREKNVVYPRGNAGVH